ncbi:unnamed protein product [Bathycoccus prasinos]
MERDEATQTTEDDGRAIPLSQRVYRYVFVRDNYPTWIETSNGWLSGWWFMFLSFGGCIGEKSETERKSS